MEDLNVFFRRLYDNFNARNVELVISQMTPDVKWANGMDGGFVHGHEGVREYWTRQFKLIDSKVTPIEILEDGGVVLIRVKQVVHNLDGELLADAIVTHVFHLDGDLIAQFDIQD